MHANEVQSATQSFVPAVMRLQELLQMFSSFFDAVCFREFWKAITIHSVSADDRILFNDVITEAQFSAYGAQQLHYDLYLLMDAFSPYTRRPHAHFKELHDASVLLLLPSDSAASATVASILCSQSKSPAF